MLIHSFATYLQYFSDVVALKSFSKAAEKNFISQSAISQAIKKLENYSGHTLFYHHQNTLQLTSEGKLLYNQVKGLIDQFEKLDSFFQQLQSGHLVKIHFGCMHSIAIASLPKVIQQFKKKFPQADISFKLGPGGYILDLVKNGELDFGIVLDNDDLTAFHTDELYEGKHEVFECSHNKNRRLLISDASYEATQFIKNYKNFYNKPPEIEMKINSWEVIARLTETGIARGYFPDYLLFHHKKLKKITYPFASLNYKMIAAFRSSKHLHTHAKDFLNLFKKSLKQTDK